MRTSLCATFMPSLDDATRLRDQFGVNDGQERRVVTDVIFDHEQDRHAHGSGVVEDITLVFDVLDDRDQDADVALPEEDRARCR